MIGLGPYLPHEQTPLGQVANSDHADPAEQVPNTEAMTYTVLAVVRLACPDTNIPATTALATLNSEQGRELALQRGANVIMPNITPTKYRPSYEIYPDKACITDSAGQCQLCIQGRVAMVGRTIGRGRGDSPNVLRRRAATASSV
jgi:biotin synthase